MQLTENTVSCSNTSLFVWPFISPWFLWMLVSVVHDILNYTIRIWRFGRRYGKVYGRVLIIRSHLLRGVHWSQIRYQLFVRSKIDAGLHLLAFVYANFDDWLRRSEAVQIWVASSAIRRAARPCRNKVPTCKAWLKCKLSVSMVNSDNLGAYDMSFRTAYIEIILSSKAIVPDSTSNSLDY